MSKNEHERGRKKREGGVEDATLEQMVLTCKCNQKRVQEQAHKQTNIQRNKETQLKHHYNSEVHYKVT